MILWICLQILQDIIFLLLVVCCSHIFIFIKKGIASVTCEYIDFWYKVCDNRRTKNCAMKFILYLVLVWCQVDSVNALKLSFRKDSSNWNQLEAHSVFRSIYVGCWWMRFSRAINNTTHFLCYREFATSISHKW